MIRILSIDGGGIRGLIPALICREMAKLANEKVKNETAKSDGRIQVRDLFNLIAGTSTGGILALGYGAGLSADELVELYETKGPQIFPRWNLSRRIGNWVACPKYQADTLEMLLKSKFKDRRGDDRQMRIDEVGEQVRGERVKVMVTGYDLRFRRPKVWKSWEDQCEIWQIARATSAAPTYFAPAGVEDGLFVDGGLMANNPAGLAYAEARKLWPDEEIFLVSLGTGEALESYAAKWTKIWGKPRWAGPVIDCMFDGTSQSTEYLMKCLLPANRYRRYQVSLDGSHASLDDVSRGTIDSLRGATDRMISQVHDDLRNVVNALKGFFTEDLA